MHHEICLHKNASEAASVHHLWTSNSPSSSSSSSSLLKMQIMHTHSVVSPSHSTLKPLLAQNHNENHHQRIKCNFSPLLALVRCSHFAYWRFGARKFARSSLD